MPKHPSNQVFLYCFGCFLLCFYTACQKSTSIQPTPGMIENQTFNQTVFIDGHSYDGSVIRNCIFENIKGDGLQLRDVSNLVIEDCIFRNISEDAIRFRNSGSSDGVQILRNQIHDIEENGILASENHINTLIQDNEIYRVATNNTSSTFGAPHHGIYFQGFNVHIVGNTIYEIKNPQGNAISIRTYGHIEKNTLYQAADHGISYFSDHPGNGELLLIENNFIYDNGKRAISLSSNGDADQHIGRALVRFNTLISNDKAPIGFNNTLTGVTIDILANIMIRTDGQTPFIFAPVNHNAAYNVTNNTDIDFVDFTNRNLHLQASSTAINAATGLADFPTTDIDGDSRTSNNLDAGADER